MGKKENHEDPAVELLRKERQEQEITSLKENDINWLDASFYNDLDKIKGHNKKLLKEQDAEDGKLFFMASAKDKRRGKAEFFGNHIQNFPLLTKTHVVKKDKDGEITAEYDKFFYIGENFNKKEDGYQVAVLTKKFRQYKLICNGEKIILLVPAELGELGNEVYIFTGMIIPMQDETDVGKNLKLKTITDIFLVHSYETTVKILPKDELVLMGKALKEQHGFGREEFIQTLHLHPNGKLYPLSEEANNLRASNKLCGNKDGYPNHEIIIGPPGTGKTTILECENQLFEEVQGILEGANTTPAGLKPSFKTDPADIGFLAKCNRIGLVDELPKMVQNQINKERQATGSYLGDLNFILEHKKRTVTSGNNNSCVVQASAQYTMVGNPMTGKPSIHVHVGVLEPQFLSRAMIWVQDSAEQDLIYSKDRVQNPANTLKQISNYNWNMQIQVDLYNKNKKNTLMKLCSRKEDGNINPFLSIYDTCKTFVSNIDEGKVKALVHETVALAREPMKSSVWLPRADHHIFLLIDGLVKLRCIFQDFDDTFTAKQEDYDLAERILVRMVKSWDTDLSPKKEGY
jgi:hypothetical protein